MLWQGATLLLAGGAVALLVLPLAGRLGPPSTSWDPKTTLVQLPPSQAAPVDDEEAEAVARIMGDLAPRKAPNGGESEVVARPEPPTPLDTDPKPAPPPPAARGNWAFLGTAVTPRARRALVKIDMNQQFVREGASVNGITLLEVHDDHIVLEENGLQRRVQRAAMVAEAMLAPPRPTPSPAAAAAARNGVQLPDALAKDEAALEAAALAHGKLKAPGMPGRLIARVMELSPEMRMNAFQTLTSPTATPEDKAKAIAELGFDADATLEERREGLKALGLNPDDPELMQIILDEMSMSGRNQR